MGNRSPKEKNEIKEVVIQYPSGSKYEGFVKNGERYGYGIYNRYDGTMYVGLWRNNKRHGEGIFTNKNGNAYRMQFVNDIATEGDSGTSIEIMGPTDLHKNYDGFSLLRNHSTEGGEMFVMPLFHTY